MQKERYITTIFFYFSKYGNNFIPEKSEKSYNKRLIIDIYKMEIEEKNIYLYRGRMLNTQIFSASGSRPE